MCVVPLGASKRGRHLRKRARGAKRQRALWQAPEADEDRAPVREQLLGHVLGERGRLGVGDVDVDCRRERRQYAGVSPATLTRRAGVDLVLPAGYRTLAAHGMGVAVGPQ